MENQINNPIQTPAQPVPPPQPKNNSNIFIGILIFLLSIVVGLGISKTTLLQTLRIPNFGVTPTPTFLPTPTPIPDPTADWKTYTSTDYSFKYPEDWSLTEQADATGKKTGNILLASPTLSQTVGAYQFNIYITNTTLPTASSYIQSLIAKTPAGKPESLSSYTQTQITVGGQPAVKLTGVFAGDSSQDQIWVLFNGKIYEITFPVGQDNPNLENAAGNYIIATQILSTFRFLGRGYSTDTSTWKTFSDKSVNFAFKYPSDLFPLIMEQNFILFFRSQDIANIYDNCIKNRLGTIQNPCSGMVFSVGLSINTNSSLNNGSPSLIGEFVDSQSRTWKTEGPVPVEGASNYRAEYKLGNSFYTVGIQIGETEFADYLGKTLIIENPKGTFDYTPESRELKNFGNLILSTFKLTQ